MTPAERIRLAEALESATGEPWIVGARYNYDEVPALDGATRLRGTVHTRPSILRAGREGWLIAEQCGRRRHRFPGTFEGRGWFGQFVPVALAMIDSFDQGLLDYVFPRERPPDDKAARRQEHYRRLIAPNSGATDNERAIAARLLRS